MSDGQVAEQQSETFKDDYGNVWPLLTQDTHEYRTAKANMSAVITRVKGQVKVLDLGPAGGPV